MKPAKGNRKLEALREAMVALVLIFFGAAFMKPDTTMVASAITGLVGMVGAFNWGNAQEHKHAATASTQAQPPTP